MNDEIFYELIGKTRDDFNELLNDSNNLNDEHEIKIKINKTESLLKLIKPFLKYYKSQDVIDIECEIYFKDNNCRLNDITLILRKDDEINDGDEFHQKKRILICKGTTYASFLYVKELNYIKIYDPPKYENIFRIVNSNKIKDFSNKLFVYLNNIIINPKQIIEPEPQIIEPEPQVIRILFCMN